jgi:catechol 2,3-dioxygenase
MDDIRVSGICSVVLGVPDLEASLAFYRDIWGLHEVGRAAGTVFLRATGAEHHVLGLREQKRAGLAGISFAAPSADAVRGLHDRAMAAGARLLAAPAPLDAAAGGGFGFTVASPDGHALTIVADRAHLPAMPADPSRPRRLSHVVLNSAQMETERDFFLDVLGFRLSDRTDRMDFIRCATDHHAIALAHAQGPSINHVAYEMQDIDGLMRGAGRLRKAGFEMEWGLGRHGPGDNVFSYFIEPNGFASEYTTAMEQIPLDAAYAPHDAKYWREFEPRPCRWGMAMAPSPSMARAMAGELVAERNADCDTVISRALAG